MLAKYLEYIYTKIEIEISEMQEMYEICLKRLLKDRQTA